MATREKKEKPLVRNGKRDRAGNQRIKCVPKALRPKYTIEELHSRLTLYDRTPFLDLLTEWVSRAPSGEALADFADRYPDKYIASLTSLARIAGYTEKTVSLNLDVQLDLNQMSDSQLEDKLRDLRDKLPIEAPRARRFATPSPADLELTAEPDGDGATDRISS